MILPRSDILPWMKKGVIIEVNLTGATLIGIERSQLLNNTVVPKNWTIC